VKYKDYYNILGVERGAAPDDIKRAYRKLARRYHPDVSGETDAEERFKEVSEAYEVLRDPEKRAAYDRLGAGWHAGDDFAPPPDWNTGRAGFDAAGFSDFFETLFGGARGGFRFDEAFQRPAPRHAGELHIDLEEAWRGATRTITIETPVADARGQIRIQPRTFNVRIPAGVSEGQRIRLADSDAGDIHLEIRIRPHPLFRLEGKDIHLDLPLAPWEAALGTRATVPTLGTEVEVRVPAGIQSQGRLRLKGRGLPGTPPGDQYLTVRIVNPPVDDAVRELYRRMAADIVFDPRAAWKTRRPS
jgi:curved DNA-binding protein